MGMSTVAKLVVSLLFAAAVAVGAVLALSSPAAAAEGEGDSARPAYGETIALGPADNLKIGASVLAGVVGSGLIGYSVWPTARAGRAPVRRA